MARSRGPSIDAFFKKYLRHPTGRATGKPFVMEGWQRAFTNYFHQVDENGDRIFRLGFLGIPRGNGKSPLAAGYGLYEMMARKDAPAVYCIAAAKDQAAIVHNFARAFVEAGPLERHGVRSGRKQITYPRGGALFEVLAASGSLIHGKNPATFIGDELHALTTTTQEETWIGMWTALHKRDNPYALGITTSGFDKATMLGRSYDEALLMPLAPIVHTNPCLRIHEDRENGILFWWYGIPEQLHHRWEEPELWRAANPASWIRIEDLKKQLAAPGFSELDFQRLHLNMWTSSRDSWLPHGTWAALEAEEGDEGYGPLEKGSRIWVGVDVGWKHDSTAVVWAARLKNGKIVLRSKVWTTLQDQVGEFVPGGTMQLALVEQFILEELKPYFRIKEVAFDPIYFGPSAQKLERRGIRTVDMPPMHAQTVEAWQLFYQKACEGLLSHNGDAVLAQHVNSAGTQMTTNGPRVRKAKSTSKIDALAAAVLAVSRCDVKTRPQRSKPGVFWMDLEEPLKPDDKPEGDEPEGDGR